MSIQPVIIDKEEFIETASGFLTELFDSVLKNDFVEIEIRAFRPCACQTFVCSETEAIEIAYIQCNKGTNVYFGVNARVGKGGKKENVHYLNTFHAEVDYGTTGHKKKSKYKTYEEALSAIRKFPIQPTIIVHSGGGFHVYWVLSNPIKVADTGIETLEAINKELSIRLGGNLGTQNISRILRIPGTFNFKMPGNPRPVTLISNTHKKCSLEDFMGLIAPPDTASDMKFGIRATWVRTDCERPDFDGDEKLLLKALESAYPELSSASILKVSSLFILTMPS